MMLDKVLGSQALYSRTIFAMRSRMTAVKDPNRFGLPWLKNWPSPLSPLLSAHLGGLLVCLAGTAGGAGHAVAKTLDFDQIRGGVHCSSIDLDAEAFDDTIGLGAFVEVPFDDRLRFGSGFDYWTTNDRLTENYDLSDFAVSVFAKYSFFTPRDGDVTAYGLAGFGVHFIDYETSQGNRDQNSASFDLGLGFEAPLSPFVALNGEMKFRNINIHDYNDYSLGAVARF